MLATTKYWCIVFVLLASISASMGRGIWVPRVGMARLLRRPYNPYSLHIEQTILLTRKRLLDSKSSESSSENTDNDDSPDTEEEGSDNTDLYNWWYYYDNQIEDSNQALENLNDDDGPVITLPRREGMFT